MKVIEKIKKGLIGIGTFVSLLSSKVFATPLDLRNEFYIPTAYGVPESESKYLVKNILFICRMFVIPIALLIGIIIYLKKSKSNIKRKIITILITLLIVAVLYFIIYIVSNVI